MSSPNTVADRADHILAMTRQLVTLIGEEIEAVQARRLDGTTGSWAEKERLVHAWRIEVAHVKADPSLLAGLDPGRRTAMREAAQSLEAALTGHAQALAAMKDVTEGLVRSIAAEIAASRGAPAGYGSTGGATGARPESAGLAVNARA